MKRISVVSTFSSVAILFMANLLPVLAQSSSVNLSTSPADYSLVCKDQVSSAYRSVDTNSLVSATLNSFYYTEAATQYTRLEYQSVMMTSKWVDPPICKVTVASLGVVFSAYNSTGFAGYLVIFANPSNMNPDSSEFQMNSERNSGFPWCHNPGTCPTGPWAGHEVFASSNQLALVYGAESHFNTPLLSYPPTGCANYQHCNLGIWVGIEDQVGAFGGNHLYQTGIDATCRQPCTGTTVWNPFYEMLPYAPVYCTSMVGYAGDSMAAEVENEYAYGGSHSLYDFYVFDFTQGLTCSWIGVSYQYGGTAYYASFIAENYKDCGLIDCSSLAKFANPVQFSYLYMFTSGNWQSAYSYSSIGYEYLDLMKNGPCPQSGCYGAIYPSSCTPLSTNIATSTISSTDTFSATWQTSQYTSFYTTGC